MLFDGQFGGQYVRAGDEDLDAFAGAAGGRIPGGFGGGDERGQCLAEGGVVRRGEVVADGGERGGELLVGGGLRVRRVEQRVFEGGGRVPGGAAVAAAGLVISEAPIPSALAIMVRRRTSSSWAWAASVSLVSSSGAFGGELITVAGESLMPSRASGMCRPSAMRMSTLRLCTWRRPRSMSETSDWASPMREPIRVWLAPVFGASPREAAA
ncbi:hypothetical protein [Streptomyces sp. NPDC018045]|uniref:hypothetical protein n=1 Tax=Streptomyces sp. NPDC018045 TaxID=3365037 RepID=UPI00378C6627